MDNLWITTDKLALIKGVSTRAIRKAIASNKYYVRKIGKSYEILISSIEPEIQAKIKKEIPVVGNILEISETEKKIALAKFDLVQHWKQYQEEHNSGKIETTNDFLILYNKNLQCSSIYNLLGKVSKSTLYRWNKTLNDNNNDWQSLVNKYVPHSKATALKPIEEEIFLSLLLHPNKINIGKAIKLTQHVLNERKIASTTCAMTYRRFANKYKKEHYDIWVLAREGSKALRDKVAPYIERDISKLEVGDVLIGDGHVLAFDVINPFTGKPCRPTLAAYQDWKSGALIGFEIMFEENTQCIASALRNAIINLGKIPKYVYQDNGRAYKSKYFTENDFVSGLFIRLGITPVFAKPYNARAKVIERFFREMQDSFERLLPSFTGCCINDKPAYKLRNEKFHKKIHNKYIPTIDEVIKFMNSWIPNFYFVQECPNVKGKSIGEVFNEGKGNGIDISRLDDLMLVTEVKSIRRNGIHFLKADYYDESLYGLRTSVVIKYSLFDLSYIKVYSIDGKFICNAKRLESINPLANYEGEPKDMEELKQRVKQQKRLEQQTVKAYIAELKHEKAYLPMFKEEDYEEYKSLEDKKIVAKTLEKTESDENLPIFQNKYERYEFLKNKQELSKTELDWLKNYETSQEYKLIYE